MQSVEDLISSHRDQYFCYVWFFSCFNFLFCIGKRVKVKVAQSCLTLCDPIDCIVQSWNSPGQNTGVDSLSLLQGIPNTGIETRSPALQADSLPAILDWGIAD